jgi:UDP-glucose 4-epimerase
VLKKVLVLGHTGFVGARLCAWLREKSPELSVEGLAPGKVDLTKEADDGLAERFTPETAVVFLSGIKRQNGDTLENFELNLKMAARVARLAKTRPVGRMIYFSSAAVYGEDVEGLGITEATGVQPTSYYGMAKFASECVLRKAFEGRSGLVCLRPATIYGPDDPAGGYGPSGFVRAAVAGAPVTFWGDGSEKREFIFVDDTVEIARRLILGDFSGTLNLVTGKSRTFREVLAVASALKPLPAPGSKPRSKAQVDHVFDNGALRRLFPDFRFTSLEDGMRRTFEAEAACAKR